MHKEKKARERKNNIIGHVDNDNSGGGRMHTQHSEIAPNRIVVAGHETTTRCRILMGRTERRIARKLQKKLNSSSKLRNYARPKIPW